MKKVLFVTPYYYPNIVGGAEVSTQLVVEGLNEYCEILTFGEECKRYSLNNVYINTLRIDSIFGLWQKVIDNKKANIIETIRLNLHTILPHKKLVEQYKEMLANLGIDTIVMNSNIDVFGRASLWKASKDLGLHTVLVLRDPLLIRKKICGIKFDKFFTLIVRKQLKYIDEFVSPSKYMIQLYKDAGLKKDVSTVIPNTIDIDMEASEFADKENIILYAGSIRMEKGIFTLIDSVKVLIDKGIDCKIKLFGRGELSEQCKRYDFVEVFDWVSKEILYANIKKSKVVVLPSEWPEAFGRILLESIANGTLSIGSNAGGIPEVLFNDLNYIFEAKDHISLSKKIERIIFLNKNEYISEVKNMQERCSAFKYDSYINSWRKILEKDYEN